MLNSNTKQNDILAKFRIKAHLRAYITEPIIIDNSLWTEAIEQLKKLPYEDKDPSDTIARELVIEAYRMGFFKHRELTDAGYELIREQKYRGHQQLANNRVFHDQTLRNCYTLKAI
jgi:hypothetical protein